VNRCPVCKNPNLRRLVELGWNAKMTMSDIANALGGIPSTQSISKHLHEHAEGAGNRDIPVENARTTRARIDDLMRRMLDEIEVRVADADAWAAIARAGGNTDALPSDIFDILSKNNQAALATILKMQDQNDKREGKKASVAVDLMRLMGGTAPPSHLIEDGNTVEGDVVEVDGLAE
jgi:hypothetical protein